LASSIARAQESSPTPLPVATPTSPPIPIATPAPHVPGRFERFARRLQLGVKPGYSQLLSGKAKDKFGNGGITIRPSFFKLRPPRQSEVIKPDFSFSRSSHDDNRFLMISGGAQYRHFFNFMPRDPKDQGSSNPNYYDKSKLEGYPYVGASLFLFGAKVRVVDEDLDTGFKLGLGSALVAGYQYKTRWRLEGGLVGQTSVAGYNFSKVRIGIDYKL
jgi:hypothetical protein